MALTSFQIQAAVDLANTPLESKRTRVLGYVAHNPGQKIVTRLQDKRTTNKETDHLVVIQIESCEKNAGHPYVELAKRYAPAESEYVFSHYLRKQRQRVFRGEPTMKYPTPKVHGIILGTNTLETNLADVQPIVVREYIEDQENTLSRRDILKINRKTIRLGKQLRRREKIVHRDFLTEGKPSPASIENNTIYGTLLHDDTPQAYFIDFEQWKFEPLKRRPTLVDRMRYEKTLVEANPAIYLQNGKQVSLAQVYSALERSADPSGQEATKTARYQEFKQWLR